MTPLAALAAAPPGAAVAFGPWFAAAADFILNRAALLVAGVPYRVAELEAYYHGPAHPDPFAHRDPVQLDAGRWYFHRTGGAYRGGSFKGVDLTLGDGRATFGVLVRAVVAPDGTRIDGPSLVVDHLLARTGEGTVAALAARTAAFPAWATSAPLALVARDTPDTPDILPVLATARVGLTLRRGARLANAPWYLGQPYRYLTDPRRSRKGRPQTVIALHQRGHDAATIHEATGVPRAAVARYVAAFAAGSAAPDFARYVGKELDALGFCAFLGSWAATYGAAESPRIAIRGLSAAPRIAR